MKLKPILIAALVAALPGAALAQDVDTTKRVDKRQQAQEKRIDKGVQSGQITEKEAADLKKGQARVDKAERKAAADGKVTKEERARLERMQDKQSKAIREQSSDKQKQGASPSASKAAAAGTSGTATVGQLTTLIAQEEKKAMADGRISAEERVRLDKLYAERDRREKQKD